MPLDPWTKYSTWRLSYRVRLKQPVWTGEPKKSIGPIGAGLGQPGSNWRNHIESTEQIESSAGLTRHSGLGMTMTSSGGVMMSSLCYLCKKEKHMIKTKRGVVFHLRCMRDCGILPGASRRVNGPPSTWLRVDWLFGVCSRFWPSISSPRVVVESEGTVSCEVQILWFLSCFV